MPINVNVLNKVAATVKQPKREPRFDPAVRKS
jgi:hypothetical protein